MPPKSQADGSTQVLIRRGLAKKQQFGVWKMESAQIYNTEQKGSIHGQEILWKRETKGLTPMSQETETRRRELKRGPKKPCKSDPTPIKMQISLCSQREDLP